MPRAKPRKSPKKQGEYEEKKVYNYVLFGLFFLFLVFFTTNKLTSEDDYFWHLATGRYIVDTGSIPSADIFSFSTEGQHWLVTEWGWDVLTYLLYNSTGFAGLSILTTLVFVIMFLVYFIMLRKFQVNYTIIFLFFILLLFGIFERLTPRPHIVTYLFFVLLLAVLMNNKYFDRGNNKLLYTIPLIFLLWANMHMGCMIGILIFGIFILSEFVIYFRPNKYTLKEIKPYTRPCLVRLCLILLASVLAMQINPHGVTTYMYAMTSHVTAKMLQEAVMEWISPFSPRIFGRFHSIIYMIFLTGILTVLYYAYRKKDLLASLICIVFAANSLRALRFTVDYMVISFLFFAAAVSYIVTGIQNEKLRAFLTIRPELKVLVSVLLVFLMINIPDNKLYHSYLEYARFAGIGIDSNYYPAKMFSFIRDNNIHEIGERPFNTFECGGYFTWNFPGKKNFFDSRDLNDFIMNEYQVIYSKNPGYEKKIKEHNFDYAICVVPDIVAEPEIMKQNVMSFFCRRSDQWKLVFWNDRSMLFVKDLPKFRHIISKHEYKYATPYNFFFQKNVFEEGLTKYPEIVRSEINRKMIEEPSGIFVRIILNNYGNRLK